MKRIQPADISTSADCSAISLLCSFDTPVYTQAGRIQIEPKHFLLFASKDGGDSKPKKFANAKLAVKALRKLSEG